MYCIDETLMDDYIYVNLCTQTNGMKFYIGAFLAKNKNYFFNILSKFGQIYNI